MKELYMGLYRLLQTPHKTQIESTKKLYKTTHTQISLIQFHDPVLFSMIGHYDILD